MISFHYFKFVTTKRFSGGRFGKIFDDDPKLWRMYADFIGSAGRSGIQLLQKPCLLGHNSILSSDFSCAQHI